ncbi:SPFH domain-containing protein [Lentzea sp. NPDC005914]|uniref:SPFH domain-containing protein n=1 Tax=Lentzea sp. NPDC005914 TaxID=3154572 RepID=UPI0033BFFDC8
MDIIGMLLLFAFVGLFGAFWVFLLSVIVLSIFSSHIRRGEVVVTYRLGSRRVDRVYDVPGRYWRLPHGDTRVLKLRVDEPVVLTQRPVEVRALENTSVVVTVRLVMEVTDPVRYGTALVGKELEDWQAEAMPGLIAAVVAGYTFAQVLNERGEVTRGIEEAVRPAVPNFGLAFMRAAIVEASGPPLPRK